MTKSDLISLLSEKYSHLGSRDVEMAIKGLIDHMARTLSTGDRIEVRGFGSFTLRYRPPRVGRNPKTGTTVELESKFTPHFKPGKELRERVNDSRDTISIKSQ